LKTISQNTQKEKRRGVSALDAGFYFLLLKKKTTATTAISITAPAAM
jgi:hypothetical protein